MGDRADGEFTTEARRTRRRERETEAYDLMNPKTCQEGAFCG